jgi:protein-disulfide isomerase
MLFYLEKLPPPPQLLPISAKECLRDEAKSLYTLIEFTDYQCPACRISHDAVKSEISKFGGKLDRQIRNLPLVSIHKFARQAALAAESARIQNKIDVYSDLLFSEGKLDKGSLIANAKKVGCDLTKFQRDMGSLAKLQVEEDEKLARKLNLSSTPTFLLCTPKGEVWRLNNYMQIKDLIR